MALIKCPECGKDISDKSLTCIHCGYPLSGVGLKSEIPTKSNSNTIKIIVAVILSAALVIVTVLLLQNNNSAEDRELNQGEVNTEQQTSENEKEKHRSMIADSRRNIAPYLEYIGSFYETGEKISLPSDLYDNMRKVEFMGLVGEVEFGTETISASDEYYIRYCSWTSFEGYSEEDFQTFAEKLNDYFGYEAVVRSKDYADGHTYRYFWSDLDNDFCVSCGHGLFAYHSNGSIVIIWANEFCEGAEFFW